MLRGCEDGEVYDKSTDNIGGGHRVTISQANTKKEIIRTKNSHVNSHGNSQTKYGREELLFINCWIDNKQG